MSEDHHCQKSSSSESVFQGSKLKKSAKWMPGPSVVSLDPLQDPSQERPESLVSYSLVVHSWRRVSF